MVELERASRRPHSFHMGDSADDLRKKARKARLLATSMTDAVTVERLLIYAAECESQALAIEARPPSTD